MKSLKTISSIAITTIIILTAISSPAQADHHTPDNLNIHTYTDNDNREWTPERMLEARGADSTIGTADSVTQMQMQPMGTIAGPPVTLTETAEPIIPQDDLVVDGDIIPTTVGKLFATQPNGEDFFCSATVVNSPGKNLLYTAAHCVYTPQEKVKDDPDNKDNYGEFTNIIFVPGYYEDVTYVDGKKVTSPQYPFGKWKAIGSSVYEKWTDEYDHGYDQSFIRMEPNEDGHNIADVVGASGIKYNEPQMQGMIDIWGYPVVTSETYTPDTSRPDSCTRFVLPSDEVSVNGLYAICWMTEGASGGPWFNKMIDHNKGYIMAVSSTRFTDSEGFDLGELYGAHNDEDTKVLYEHVINL